MLFKKFENSAVLIVPGIRAGETMPFRRVDHHLKFLVAALDQLFGVLKGILRANIIINQTVKQNYRMFKF
jgi:hypothetical protein